MADLATLQQSWDSPGIAVQAAAAGGDTFDGSSNVALLVINEGAGAVAVTFDSVAPAKPGIVSNDEVKSVPAGARHLIRPPSAGWANFKDPTTGRVSVAYDQVVDVFVAAVRL